MTPRFRPSYWETQNILGRPDYLIVGAGFTGLYAALEIRERQPSADVLVIDRHPIPRGASTRNAGFACFGSPTELLADIDAHGEEACRDTVMKRLAGMQRIEERYGARDIGWQPEGGYELFDDPDSWAQTLERLPYLNRVLEGVTGLRATWIESGHARLFNPLEAGLDPARLWSRVEADARAAGVRLLYGLEVSSVHRGKVRLGDYGDLSCGEVLLATNAFTAHLSERMTGGRIRPVRNQVIVTRPLPELQLPGCYHYHQGYVYLRQLSDRRLLIGGGRHRAGEVSETNRFGPNNQIVEYLLGKVNDWLGYPLTRGDIHQQWSGILAQGAEKEPVLEQVAPGITVAARLAGMGVALSAELGRRAAGLVTAQ